MEATLVEGVGDEVLIAFIGVLALFVVIVIQVEIFTLFVYSCSIHICHKVGNS